MKQPQQNPIAARMHDKMRRIEICTRRLSTDSLHGGTRSRFRGRGMDFDEVREYEPGDDVRAIDWNATARTGRVFVKKYREERQLTIVFVVDMSASGALGAGDMTKQEQAIEIAGVLALSAQSRDDRIGMVLFTNYGGTIRAARARPPTHYETDSRVGHFSTQRARHESFARPTQRARTFDQTSNCRGAV
jgi:uncharacterized protein (DUF58 family)